MAETDIARTGKVRLRNGAKVSPSIILRAGKSEKVDVKGLIPLHAFFTHEEVTVDHSKILERSFGDTIYLREAGHPSEKPYRLERSPLVEAAGRRLAHYVDSVFVFPIVMALIAGLFYLIYWVIVLAEAAWNSVAGFVNSSIALQVLLALGILVVSIVAVGFLLAVGWRLSGRLFGSKR